jgi:hypothetical protein
MPESETESLKKERGEIPSNKWKEEKTMKKLMRRFIKSCLLKNTEGGKKSMKRSLVVGMMVLVFLFAGSAFGAEPIKLGMSTWLGYAPLYLAKEKGFFKKQGVVGHLLRDNVPEKIRQLWLRIE